MSTLEVERAHACLFADPVPRICRGNSAPTSEHVVFAFDSALKSHEVSSSLIQVGLRGLSRKCFNCAVGQRNEIYSVSTSRTVSTLRVSTFNFVGFFRWKYNQNRPNAEADDVARSDVFHDIFSLAWFTDIRTSRIEIFSMGLYISHYISHGVILLRALPEHVRYSRAIVLRNSLFNINGIAFAATSGIAIARHR